MDGRAPLPHPRRGRLAAILAVLAVAAALASPARALDDAGDPSLRWPTDGPAVQTALAVAEGFWGVAPCHGEVALWWEDLDPSVDAQAVWDNPIGQYAAPVRNTDCEISFNPRGQWDWPKLCTIMVHEVGHLAGHDHVADVDDVMYFSFRQPLRQCLEVPEPGAAPVPAPPAAAPAPAAPAPPVKPRTPAGKAATRPTAKQRAKTAATRRAAKRRDARRTAPARRVPKRR